MNLSFPRRPGIQPDYLFSKQSLDGQTAFLDSRFRGNDTFLILAVKRAGAGAEGLHHLFVGAGEEAAEQFVEQGGFEVEVEVELHLASTALRRREFPVIAELAEGALHQRHFDGGGGVVARGGVQRDAGSVLLGEVGIADDQIGNKPAIAALTDAAGGTPGQKFGIARHIGHQLKQLTAGIREMAGFVVAGHVRALRDSGVVLLSHIRIMMGIVQKQRGGNDSA